MNRRDFLQPVSLRRKTPAAAGYELLIFATNWGYTGTWKEFCALIKNHGYDGAEIWLPDESQRDEIFAAFKKYDLKFGILIGSGDGNYQKNLRDFTKSLESAVALNPVYINCHSGKDFFTFDQNTAFIELTVKSSKESGVPIYHETHRSRILYSAPVARLYVEKIAGLQITLDISHWCNVHESLLADQAETVAMILKRVGHIHARIGHAEGPQVNDPRAPEWKNEVNAHFAWWDKVVQQKKTDGKVMTFLTEFGPVNYMPALAFSRQPIANQWEINLHMLKSLRSRYA